MTMNRGLSQVMYKMAPGSTFSHEEHNMIEMVGDIAGEKLGISNDDEIIEAAHHQLDAWPGGVESLLAPTRDNWAVVKPEIAYTKVFPRVFRCKRCGRIHDYSGGHIHKIEDRGLNCQHCPGTLTQLHHVLLCPDCSEIKSVEVPGCHNDSCDAGWKDVVLDDSADRYEDFRWWCKGCGADIERPFGGNCDCGTRMIPSVHSASKTYRIHDFTRIDLTDREIYRGIEDASDEDVEALILGAYFGLFDHPEKSVGELAEASGATLAGDKDLSDLPPEEREIIRKRVELTDGDERQEIIDEVRNAVPHPEPSDTLRRFVALQESVDLVRPWSGGRPTGRSSALMDRMGIDDIAITDEFPIISSVFGYHRTFGDEDDDDDGEDENSMPSARHFPMITVDGERKAPIYTTRSETEALIVRLDPRKVGHWLYENDHLDQDLLGVDKEEARKILYAQMGVVEPYTSVGSDSDDAPNHSETTVAMHRLLHSVTHLLMDNAAVHSGIEETTFSEYLFPQALSAAIYSKTTQQYTAGGLFTLAERNLETWLDGALESAQTCVMDHTCSDIWDGSCMACLHANEVSCQYYNKNLSRNDLFGEQLSSDRFGFWSEW